MTIEKLKETYIPVAANSITDGKDKTILTLYAENWNDFDNDHYYLAVEAGGTVDITEAETIDEVNELVKRITGNSDRAFFSKDEDGEIQGDIYGKVVGKEGGGCT